MNSPTSTPASGTAGSAPRALPPVFREPNFRWLMSGSAISLLGDQFSLVALPWLVLRLTGDPVALGTVLALVGVPRAVLMLLGGALVDRWTPRRVLMRSRQVNAVLLAVLALGVALDALSLAGIHLLAFAIGIAGAFGVPAATAMVPHALAPQHLATANGVLMGLRQLSMFVGPLAAGALVAWTGLPAGGAVGDRGGIALAFALDALSFAVAAWTLSRVHVRGPATRLPAPQGLWSSVMAGLRHVARDAQLRACFLYWAAVAVLVLGPLHIAVPVLAERTPGLGAAALGLMLGAHGGGTLAGMAVSALRPGLRIGTLGTTLLLADAAIGLLCLPLGWIGAAWQGALLMFSIGVLGGFVQVDAFTWMQRRVPAEMVGRTSSLFMFIFMGLVPLASAATGWLLRAVPLPMVFAGGGTLLVAAAIVAWLATPIRHVRAGAPAHEPA